MQLRPVFQVPNALAPAEGFGPLYLPVTLDFGTLAYHDVDLQPELTNGTMTYPQSVYVNNFDNDNPLTLTFGGTGYVLKLPANCGGIFPIFASGVTQCRVETTPAANLEILVAFVNVPMPLTQWGPNTVNVANVTATATPVQRDVTQTNFAMTGGDDTALASNAKRRRVVLQAHPNNAGPIAIIFGTAHAPVLATDFNLLPGERLDTGTGPVSTAALHAIGTAADQLIIQEYADP